MAFLRANPNNSGLRGRMAGQVYATDGADTVVREFTPPTRNATPALLAQEARFTDGSDAWGGLTDLERAAWADAAKSVMSKDPRRIRPRAISGRSLYIGRTSKALQAGAAAAPTLPPAQRFSSKGIPLTLTASAGGLTVDSGESANAAGVTTEIRVQRLSVAYAKPQENGYRTAAFHAFSRTDHAVTIPVRPGSYAVLAQDVLVATGETSGVRLLGTATVALALESGGRTDEAGDAAMAA